MTDEQCIDPSDVALRRHVVAGRATLQGAVVRHWQSRDGLSSGLLLRDGDYKTPYTVRAYVPRQSSLPTRGTLVSIQGAPRPSGDDVVWSGDTLRVDGLAPGYDARVQHIARIRSSVGGRLQAVTGRCATLFVVTGPSSKALNDIRGAIWPSGPDEKPLRILSQAQVVAVECDLHSVVDIASKLTELRSRATVNDVVVVARGGGERKLLDHFEAQEVVTALGALAMHCPTVTAIGHADDELMLEGVVLRTFKTPSDAAHRLNERLWRARLRSYVFAGARAAAPLLVAALLWFGYLAHTTQQSVTTTQAALQPVSLVPPHLEEPAAATRKTAQVTDRPRAGSGRVERMVAAAKPAPPHSAASTASSQSPQLVLPSQSKSKAVEPPALSEEILRALQSLRSLVAPFELAPDVPIHLIRARCAAFYGMWSSSALGASCHLPGGRQYLFGLTGTTVGSITLRQAGASPVPLLAAQTIAELSILSPPGRSPRVLIATPRQLTVEMR